MNAKTARLLRKAANGDPDRLKLLKKLYPQLPTNKRAEFKGRADDMILIERHLAGDGDVQ